MSDNISVILAENRDGEHENNNLPVPSISFSGCGFLGVYYIGVIDCLKKYIPQVLQVAKFSGASAGSLIACSQACNVSVDMGIEFVKEMALKAQQCSLGVFDVKLGVDEILRKALKKHLPQNAHKLCTDRLMVSVSNLLNLKVHRHNKMWRNEKVTKFQTRAYLIETVLCSCYIPVFSGSDNPILNKEITMDGAFSDNQPRFDENTITVSPFAGDSDICPQDTEPHLGTKDINNNSINMSYENLMRAKDGFFIPAPDDFRSYYQQGYKDALRFLTEKSFIRCPAHPLPAYQLLSVPAIVTDCATCNQCVQHAHRHKDMQHDEHFKNLAEQLKAEQGYFKAPPFSMWEVFKLMTVLPKELLSSFTTLSRFFISHSSSAQSDQDTENLMQQPGMQGIIREVVSSLLDPSIVLRTILFRTSTLLLWKFAALMCRVLGYVLTTNVWLWFVTYYKDAVEENKVKLAQLKKEEKEKQ